MIVIDSKVIHVQREDSRVSLCGFSPAKEVRSVKVRDDDTWLITCEQCLHILEKAEKGKEHEAYITNN